MRFALFCPLIIVINSRANYFLATRNLLDNDYSKQALREHALLTVANALRLDLPSSSMRAASAPPAHDTRCTGALDTCAKAA
jgi:hypothetical protein